MNGFDDELRRGDRAGEPAPDGDRWPPGDELSPETADAMLRDVLRRTSGPACSRAGSLLPAFVDRELDPVDRDLIDGHLGGCPSCRALAGALAWTGDVLVEIAAIDPGPDFAAGVLGRTSRTSTRARSPGSRLRAWWGHLAARPRFALEGAYVGMVLLMLVFGTPGSPLRSVPGRALEVAQANPVEVVGRLVTGDSWLGRSLRRAGRTAWDATGGEVVGSPGIDRVSARATRARGALGALERDGNELMGAVADGDAGRVAIQLEAVGGDLRRLWISLTSDGAASSIRNEVADGDSGGAPETGSDADDARTTEEGETDGDE